MFVTKSACNPLSRTWSVPAFCAPVVPGHDTSDFQTAFLCKALLRFSAAALCCQAVLYHLTRSSVASAGLAILPSFRATSAFAFGYVWIYMLHCSCGSTVTATDLYGDERVRRAQRNRLRFGRVPAPIGYYMSPGWMGDL